MSNTLTQSPYVNRFERLLESLQSKLSKLETKLDSIDDDHPDKQQSRLNVLEEINKTKHSIENTLKNLECSKTMTVIRSEKVPSNVADHNVWNDCWYDEERKLYVTHNKYFKKFEDVWKRPHQMQYQKETSDDGVVIILDDVKFKFGYPSVIQNDSKGRDMWFILPTLTDTMLTEEIVTSRIKPITLENGILYETVSEQWITVGSDGFNMCERENEISDKLKLFPPVPIKELKTLYGRQ